MIVDCYKHNQVVTTIADGVPDMVLFLEQINTYPGNLSAAINLLNTSPLPSYICQ